MCILTLTKSKCSSELESETLHPQALIKRKIFDTKHNDTVRDVIKKAYICFKDAMNIFAF